MTEAAATPLARAQVFREKVRRGEHARHTAGQAPGMVQGNVAILPADLASDFLRFRLRNPKPCPLIGMSEPGIRDFRNWVTLTSAPTCRRTGSTSMASWSRSRPTFPTGGGGIWWPSCWAAPCRSTRPGGCRPAPAPRRARPRGADVPDLDRDRAGRPVPRPDGGLDAAVHAEGRDSRHRGYLAPSAHARRAGALRRSGRDRHRHPARPDYGEPTIVERGEVPVLACGVTPQAVVAASRPALCITHKPGHMLVTDRRIGELAAS